MTQPKFGLIIAGAAGHMGHRAVCLLPYLQSILSKEGIDLELAAVLEVPKTFRALEGLFADLLIEPALGFFAGDLQGLDDCLEQCRDRYKALGGGAAALFYDASPATRHLLNVAATERFGISYLGEKPLILDDKSLPTLSKHLSQRSRRIFCDFIETESLPFYAAARWFRAKDLRVKSAHLIRESSGGLKKLVNPKARAGVSGGCMIDKSIHDISLAHAFAKVGRAGPLPSPVVHVNSFEVMPYSLESILLDQSLCLSTQNTKLAAPVADKEGVEYQAADAMSRFSVTCGDFEANIETSWVGVRSTALEGDIASLIKERFSWEFVGEGQLLQREPLPAVPITDTRWAILETDDQQRVVLDFMYKMKSGLGQGGWVIDDSGKVTTLEQVNNIEFGQNTLGRIILKAIRCVQHRKSDTEDSAFFDENAVGWVHDALFNAREAGLQMVAHESDFVSGGRSLVRDHFSECSLSLKDFASIRGLIFDLDNTLFRTGGAISSIEPLVFAVGEHYAVADMDVLRDRLWKESVDRIISGLQLRPGKSETDAKEAIWAAYGVLEVRNPIPMLEGWGELKDLLNSSKVDRALLSSGVWSLQARKIEAAIGVQQIFHPIIIDDARSALGKRRLMEAILEEWGYEPRQVLVVGDDREAEMVFGQELGCRLAHVCSGGGCECDLEFCLNDLAELVDMLKSRIYF